MPKISELNAITSVANTDLLMVVHDPNGSPSTNKITVNNFIISTGLNTLADVGDLGEILVSNGTSSVWKKNPDVRAVGAIFDRTSYTATVDDSVILVVPATQSNAITITLPTVGVPVGKVYSIRNIDSSFGQYPVIVNVVGSVLEDPHFNTPVSSYNVQYTGDVETWIFDGLSYRNISSLSNSPVFRGSANSFQQVVLQNVSNANNASGDYVVYNNAGNYLEGTGPFVDMGINSSNYDSTEYGNVWTQSDSYLYNMGGNLIIGPETNHSIKFIANGTDSDDVKMVVNSTGVFVNTTLYTTTLSPNIAYTGVFNGYPATIPVIKGQGIAFTSNNYVLETSNKYWWDGEFDTANYDLSGVETLNFYNLGGIKLDFRLGGKSENFLTSVNLRDIVAIQDDFYIRDLSALTSFSANNLSYIGNNFQIDTMDNANTQFNFPNLKTIINNFYYTYNDTLVNTPQFPALETIQNSINIYYNGANQNTMTFDSLRYVGYVYIYENNGMLTGPRFPALTSMDYFSMYNNDSMINPPTFPVLETITSSFNFYGHAVVTSAPALPSLVTSDSIQINDNALMANGFNFSSLVTVNGSINFDNNVSLTVSPTFPLLQSINGAFTMDNNPLLTSGLSFSALKTLNGNFSVNGCGFNETSINNLLVKLASLNGTSGTTSYDSRFIYLNGGTNAIPTGAGLAAKTTLEGRGCTVYVNS
jgi:hypothetical protein